MDTVGRYELGAVLGTGGMGTVYRARDPQLDRDVALKVIPLGDDAGEKIRRRVGREARALASLNDPHVVQVYDAGIEGSDLFISMELVEGSDLGAWLEAKPRTEPEILEVFSAAGRGLAAAHGRGVIHRDFKPGNVLLGDDGRVRVVDFGLARLLIDEDSEESDGAGPPLVDRVFEAVLTIPGSVLGTPAYMSPEQHACLPLDERTDQYSFCVALFEAVHGRRPFEGSIKAIAKHKASYAGTPDAAGAKLQALIDRGLSPSRRDRFATMHALLTELDALRQPRRRHIWPFVLGLGAAVLAGQAVLLLQDDAEERPECRAHGQLDAVWNVETAAALRDAFGASGHHAATEYAGHVREQLDNYGARWLRAYDDGCASGELPVATAACLHDARAELDRHVRRFTDVEIAPEDVARAPEVLAQSPSPEACLHEARLHQKTSNDARRMLGELRALTSVPDSPRDATAVRARILEIRADAEQRGWVAVQGQAELALSTSHGWANELDDAAAASERAHLLAASAGDDRLQLEAAARSAALAASRLRDADRERWMGRTEALLDRLDARGTRLHARVLTELGTAALQRGRTIEGEHFFAEAYAIAKAFPEETATLTSASYAYGLALAGTHKYAQAQPYFEESLALATAALGAESIPAGDALTGSCSVLDALGEHQRAAQACRRAYAVIVRYRGAEATSAVHAQLRLAQALRNAAEYTAAIEVATQAARVADRSGDEPTLLRGHAHLFLGTTLHADSQYADGVRELKFAASLIEASVGPSNGVYAEALGALGLAQFDAGELADAEATMRRGLATMEGRETTAYERVGGRVDLAKVLRAAGRPADARAELEKIRGEIPKVAAAEIRGDGLLILAQTIGDKKQAVDLALAAAIAYEEAGGRFLQYAEEARAFAADPTEKSGGER